MTCYFERYFERARRARPAQLAGARRRGRGVLDPVGGRRAIARAASSSAGSGELRGFIDAGDTERLGAPRRLDGDRRRRRVRPRRDALGRVRRAHRHVPRRRPARRRRADAALHGRAHAGAGLSVTRGRRRMLDQREFVPVAEGLIAGTAQEPELIGSSCRRCATVTFPRQALLPALHLRGRRGAPAAASRHAVELDDPVLRAEVAPVRRGAERRLRAVRRRLRRAARRGARRGAPDRGRPGPAAHRHADGADADPGARRLAARSRSRSGRPRMTRRPT